MQQLPKLPKLQNILSFGKETNINDNHDSSQVAKFFIGQSGFNSFQNFRQANYYGLNVKDVSSRQDLQNCDSAFKKLPNEVRRQILYLIKQNLKKIREDMMKIKQQHITFMKYTRTFDKKAIQSRPNFTSLQYLTLFNQKRNQSKHKKQTQIKPKTATLKINQQYKIDIKTDNKTQLLKQKYIQMQHIIETLKQQNQLKQRYIEILKKQIKNINNFSKTQEIYQNQRLRVMELGWQLKINDILKNINGQNGHNKQSVQRRQRKNGRLTPDIINEQNKRERQWKYKQNKAFISQDQTHESHVFNLKGGSIQYKYNQINKPYASYIRNVHSRNSSRISEGSNRSKKNLSQITLQKPIILASNQRKQTKNSYDRVSNKIKKFEQEIRKQIDKIQT